jgi:uncharacterized protein YcnI
MPPPAVPSIARGLRRVAPAAAVAAALVFAVPGVAAAHVTVSADNAAKGGYAKLVFRVPNESDKAVTTKLVFTLPVDTPIGSVRTKPVPGWAAVVTTSKLAKPVKAGDVVLTEAPSSVTYTAAAGGGIKPGQFDEFELSGGPLPTLADQLVLPATQYYSDGTVVRWDQPTTGSTEPERPAPTLALAAASGDGHGHDDGSGASGEDDVARVLGGAALLVSLGAAVLGGLAWRRSGRRTAGGPGVTGTTAS